MGGLWIPGFTRLDQVLQQLRDLIKEILSKVQPLFVVMLLILGYLHY